MAGASPSSMTVESQKGLKLCLVNATLISQVESVVESQEGLKQYMHVEFLELGVSPGLLLNLKRG